MNFDKNVKKIDEKTRNFDYKGDLDDKNVKKFKENLLKSRQFDDKNDKNIEKTARKFETKSSSKPLPFLKEIRKNKEKKEKEIQQQKEGLDKKNQEKKLIKKIFKERTKTHQPVMKNYLNYLLFKIENPKN